MDHEEFTVYAEWDRKDYTSNLEVGDVDLNPDDMPDRVEINGCVYVLEV